MKESDFQKKLKKTIKERFPGSLVFKTDPQQLQGIPDLLILYGNKWAALEVKKNKKEAEKSQNDSNRFNQNYRVRQMAAMSFASYIFPENEQEVLHDLERLFED